MVRRGLDRDQVVEAAIEQAADGLQTVTLARIAQRLGVRPPSLYNHIENRDALLRQLSLRGIEGLNAATADAAVGRAGEDALRSMARAYRAYAHAHPGLYEASLAAPPSTDAELNAAAARAIEVMTATVREWELDGDELVDIIRAIRSSLHGFVTLERQGAFALPRDLDRSYERLVDALIKGLRPDR